MICLLWGNVLAILYRFDSILCDTKVFLCESADEVTLVFLEAPYRVGFWYLFCSLPECESINSSYVFC